MLSSNSSHALPTLPLRPPSLILRCNTRLCASATYYLLIKTTSIKTRLLRCNTTVTANTVILDKTCFVLTKINYVLIVNTFDQETTSPDIPPVVVQASACCTPPRLAELCDRSFCHSVCKQNNSQLW